MKSKGGFPDSTQACTIICFLGTGALFPSSGRTNHGRHNPGKGLATASIQPVVKRDTGHVVKIATVVFGYCSIRPVQTPDSASGLRIRPRRSDDRLKYTGIPASATQVGRMPDRCESPQASIPAPTAVCPDDTAAASSGQRIRSICREGGSTAFGPAVLCEEPNSADVARRISLFEVSRSKHLKAIMGAKAFSSSSFYKIRKTASLANANPDATAPEQRQPDLAFQRPRHQSPIPVGANSKVVINPTVFHAAFRHCIEEILGSRSFIIYISRNGKI